MIRRFSSRRAPLANILNSDLLGAASYDRIAGYFTSSILEVAGEALESMAPGAIVRVVCNSTLSPLDVKTARAAKQAMYREWCAALPADITPTFRERLEQLFRLLSTGRLRVRVLPDSTFGLIHGKAGVITRADGSQISFIGSTNESKSAWKLNYELVWTDDDPEAVRWVRDEFEALWSSPDAFELADAVVRDIERLTRRKVIPTVDEWKADPEPDPAAPVVELPIYRRENGLWAHQKAFVSKAFEEHQRGGARFVLADQVGLGKTVQLGLAAKLMALWGDKPVLILVPKTLMEQWQDELRDLLALPSARWTGQQWVDERGNAYPSRGIEDLKRCPRRVGLVSTGLIVHGGQGAELLAALEYECVILDEAHRARRRNIGQVHRNERADPNNLLRFLQDIAPRTRSLLLATATPVQLDPIEAWDLLEALSRGHDGVLGTRFSRWRTDPRGGLELVAGRAAPPESDREVWEWIRDPLPPADEGPAFQSIRSRLHLSHGDWSARPEDWDRLRAPEQSRVRSMRADFFRKYNPYILHIIRRSREYLERTNDPTTNEPYLKPVRVRLFGERPEDAVPLPTYLEDAFRAAESFCEALSNRPGLSSGFLKTILLRRLGSTVYAGRKTAIRMLGEEQESQDEDDESEEINQPRGRSSIYPLSKLESQRLREFLGLIDLVEDDPKAQVVENILLHGDSGKGWLNEGCIIFSQYYDSVSWLAGRLSALLPQESIGVYAGARLSGVYRGGEFVPLPRDEIKGAVRRDELRLILGTDAASEGLNLQRLGTLINLDLPWNPTRLEQRKGRIQRIGQVRDEVLIYNLRYRGSVEDRVHELLSQRQEEIYGMFGQIPDTLEDVWIHVALRNEERARQIIDSMPIKHPFDLRYNRIVHLDWESCYKVLSESAQDEVLMKGW